MGVPVLLDDGGGQLIIPSVWGGMLPLSDLFGGSGEGCECAHLVGDDGPLGWAMLVDESSDDVIFLGY